MEPERSEVINGPNLGGFLGLAPDLRRLGRQGLAWPSGTQGLLLDQAFGISQRAALAATQPATASSQAYVLPSQQGSLFLFTPGHPSSASPASSGSPAENFFF